MIFSNKCPNLKKPTDNRWKILKPTEERLMDITDKAKQTCKEMKSTIDNRKYGKAEDDASHFKTDEIDNRSRI